MRGTKEEGSTRGSEPSARRPSGEARPVLDAAGSCGCWTGLWRCRRADQRPRGTQGKVPPRCHGVKEMWHQKLTGASPKPATPRPSSGSQAELMPQNHECAGGRTRGGTARGKWVRKQRKSSASEQARPEVEQTLFSGTQVVWEVSASITHHLGKTLTPETFQNTQVSLSGISRAAPPALAGTE